MQPSDMQGEDLMVSVNAFHEKAGRSQGDWFWYLLVTLFSSPPSRHCRHPSIRTLDERFDSLGASWVFSFQPVLPPVYRPRFHLQDESWARRLTQSPELGFRLWTFPFAEGCVACLRTLSRLQRSGAVQSRRGINIRYNSRSD
jgi:hypothetical protein